LAPSGGTVLPLFIWFDLVRGEPPTLAFGADLNKEPLGWSKNTGRATLNRTIYVGVLERRCSTGDAKYRGQENVISVQAPHLRIIPEDLERRVRARQTKTIKAKLDLSQTVT